MSVVPRTSARVWSMLFAVVVACAFGCARRQDQAAAPVAMSKDTLVVLKGPELARRADSSVVVVEVEKPEGNGQIGRAHV